VGPSLLPWASLSNEASPPPVACRKGFYSARYQQFFNDVNARPAVNPKARKSPAGSYVDYAAPYRHPDVCPQHYHHQPSHTIAKNQALAKQMGVRQVIKKRQEEVRHLRLPYTWGKSHRAGP
jgi:hypothetical protein